MNETPPRAHRRVAERLSTATCPEVAAPNLTQAVARNGLLSRLPADRRPTLLAGADVVRLRLRECLFDLGAPIEHLYFPVSTVVSVVAVMRGGDAVEIAAVGNEGVVGLPALLGESASPTRVFAQVSGFAVRAPTATFASAMTTDVALGTIVRGYTMALLTQVAQTAACNRLHGVENRCARWLLMTHDRVGGDCFEVTQDFLAQMLGVRRATVSTAAGALQRAGLIRYSRGKIRVLDRDGLERAACECFATVRAHYARLLG